MRSIADAGFDVGVHCYDHVRWQDGVSQTNYLWTRWQLELAVNAFGGVFGRPPHMHGAAGWQLNEHVPALQEVVGFRVRVGYARDASVLSMVRRRRRQRSAIPNDATHDSMSSWVDLMSRARGVDDFLLSMTEKSPHSGHVYTLHAELEGGAYLQLFTNLLSGWRAQGYTLSDMPDLQIRICPGSLASARD